MKYLSLLFAGFAFCAVPANADIVIHDAYARVATPMAKSGAAFLTIMNNGDIDDRLVGVESPAAKRVELHSHVEQDGVMQMQKAEDGFAVPAGEMYQLKRGGDHVMFMGLTSGWEQGDVIPVTFRFEHAGEITADISVDLERQPKVENDDTNTDQGASN